MGREPTVTGWFLADDFAGESEGWQNMFWKGMLRIVLRHSAREYSLRLHSAGFALLEATPGAKEIGNFS